MNTHQFDAAAARLTDAEHCLPMATSDDQRAIIRGQIQLARASLARLAGDLVTSVAQAEQACALLPAMQPWLHMHAVAALTVTRAYQLSGNVSAARERRVRDAIAAVRNVGNLSACRIGMVHLGRMQVLQGRRRQAAATYAEVLQLLGGQADLRHLGGAADYHVSLIIASFVQRGQIPLTGNPP